MCVHTSVCVCVCVCVCVYAREGRCVRLSSVSQCVFLSVTSFSTLSLSGSLSSCHHRCNHIVVRTSLKMNWYTQGLRKEIKHAPCTAHSTVSIPALCGTSALARGHQFGRRFQTPATPTARHCPKAQREERHPLEPAPNKKKRTKPSDCPSPMSSTLSARKRKSS